MIFISKIPVRSWRLLFAVTGAAFAAAALAQGAPPSAPTTPGLTKSLPDKPVRLRDPAAPLLPTPARQQAATPTPPPPPVPAMRDALDMADLSHQYQFVNIGNNADIFLSGGGLDVLNSIWLNPGGWVRITIKPKQAAAFPSGSLTLIISGRGDGRLGNLTMRSDTDASRTVTCPILRGYLWWCSLTVPVGVIGGQQKISLSTSGAGMSFEKIGIQ
jgi:hypothetical protein